MDKARGTWKKRIPFDSDLDDLLDWLGIDCQDSEFEQNLLVIDSMKRQLRTILKFLQIFQRVKAKAKDCLEQGYERSDIERRVNKRMFRLSETIWISAQDLNRISRDWDKAEYADLQKILRLDDKVIQMQDGSARKIGVDVASVLAAALGHRFIDEIGMDNICFGERYTLGEVRGKIEWLKCLYN